MKASFRLPKISVVTPSYNQGAFLEETILSVIGQQYPNLEYIVIDGKSNDDSADILKKYESYFHYWISEKDNGQSHAINKGFSMATGDILCWLNSDDLLMPGALLFVADWFTNITGSALLFGNCLHFRETGKGVSCYGSDIISAHASATLENYDYIIQPSAFWSRSAWEQAGALREDMHYAFDWEWFLRAKGRGVNFFSDSKCLSLYRIHESHKTGTGGLKRQEEIEAVYEAYSEKYKRLYTELISEKSNLNSASNKMVRYILKRLKKPSGDGYLLKTLKPKKYMEYSGEEIQNCLYMR